VTPAVYWIFYLAKMATWLAFKQQDGNRAKCYSTSSGCNFVTERNIMHSQTEDWQQIISEINEQILFFFNNYFRTHQNN